jgi:hypothetical protein
VQQRRSSLLAEFGWLAYFIAVFAIFMYLFNIFVVPHHFNDKVADVLAGVVAALAYTITRAKWRR